MGPLLLQYLMICSWSSVCTNCGGWHAEFDMIVFRSLSVRFPFGLLLTTLEKLSNNTGLRDDTPLAWSHLQTA